MSNNNTSTWEVQEILRLDKISSNIRLSYIWVVFVLGFPTNILSIATILTMRTLTPATFYVAILGLCDALTLVVKLVGHQMATHEAYFGTVGCKLVFVSEFISTLANWILVFICAERFVSVCLPLKKHIIFTKRRAYISCSVLTTVLFLIFVSIFAVMRDSDQTGLQCGTLDEYLDFWVDAWPWINVCLYLLFPLPIIVILTILIVVGISRSRRDRRRILHNGNGYDDGNSRLLKETERLERNITIMLVVAATVFMVFCLPACIFFLSYEKPIEGSLKEARQKLFEQIGFVFVDSTHAVNFYLYFLSSKKFRDQFFFLITCRKWPRYLQKSAVNGSSMGFTTKYTVAKSTEDVSHI